LTKAPANESKLLSDDRFEKLEYIMPPENSITLTDRMPVTTSFLCSPRIGNAKISAPIKAMNKARASNVNSEKRNPIPRRLNPLPFSATKYIKATEISIKITPVSFDSEASLRYALKPANNRTDPTTPHIGGNRDKLKLANRMVMPIQRKKSMNEKALIEEDSTLILNPESLADFEFLMIDRPKMIAHIMLRKKAIKEATSAGGIFEESPNCK
jgi:hypothetical protein